MKTSVAEAESTKKIVESVITSGLPPEKILERLNSYDIQWYMTKSGDLMIKYWQLGAEDFLPLEHVAKIREGQVVPPEASRLEWLSSHLSDLKTRYEGQWIAILGDRVIANAANLPDLLQQVQGSEVESPFITQIPSEPIIWATAYASQNI